MMKQLFHLDDNAKFKLRVKATHYKGKAMDIFRYAILIGISYIILSPLISILSKSFFGDSDVYNSMVYLIPAEPSFKNYELALLRMDYWPTLIKTMLYIGGLTLVQLFICSLVGYGFARFNFPLKKLLFGCLILSIVIPSYTIMLPLYMHFRDFDPLGLFSLLGMGPQNWLKTIKPVYLMTFLGCGLNAGIFIYIFQQFFRGVPKELEEAALVDGAGFIRTFFQIMLPCAKPSIVTVAVFSIVWQYNDNFYASLFGVNSDYQLGVKLAGLGGMLDSLDKIVNPEFQELYINAGVVMMIIPILIIYIILQKSFIEGVERSGIVG
ncbi:MAG: carbohydrate ABC transporter permease [Agathobacter sp.]|nr:carbohydrate ABC transporter permease [Agathobacter sp.]